MIVAGEVHLHAGSIGDDIRAVVFPFAPIEADHHTVGIDRDQMDALGIILGQSGRIDRADNEPDIDLPGLLPLWLIGALRHRCEE